MQVKKAVVWWLLTNQNHPSLTDDDKQIEALMPLVDAMFPGINYYSVTGFHDVMHGCVAPALGKQFHALRRLSANQIGAGEMVNVTEVMPSRGYQWQDDDEWKARFRTYLTG